MSRNHLANYFQKYYIFISSATIIAILAGCAATKKVPDGDYLLVKNHFKYEDEKVHEDEISDYVYQKPNRKQLFLFPVGLWLYNAANPKYDTIMNEFMTYPSDMRNQKLLDSLFIRYNRPEYVGKNLFWERLFHNWGQAPTILDQSKTQTSADFIKKRLIYRGYWDAKTTYKHQLDSAAKKAEITYTLQPNDATYISDYYYDIPDKNIKRIYEEDLTKSIVRSKNILDQTDLEKEVKRINELMRERGYYLFNNSNREISFVADTLSSRKQVPLTMEIRRDSANTPYKIATIGNIDVAVVENASDYPKNTVKDTLRGIRFHKIDDSYKTNTLWRAVILKTGEVYNQKNVDLTRRNFQAMNNFNILTVDIGLRKNPDGSIKNDSIVDALYILKPLLKYDFKVATDINYSQLLNLAASPSVDLTRRNIFGGAENLNTNISWIVGRVRDSKDITNRVWANEISFNTALNFPKLLLPFTYYKIVPKKYSPTSSINLGASLQKNIGMDRININTGISFNANVKDIVTHRLTLLNTQFSLTGNKNKYYDYFPRDKILRDEVFQNYSPALYNQFLNDEISSDDLSIMILTDEAYNASLSGSALDNYYSFLQSLINKDRQTQDVLINSMVYNFIYNEIGKKEFENPFYFNGKVEFAGNLLNLLTGGSSQEGITTGAQKTLFGIPFSQFVKMDFDVRKYIQFGKKTLAMRQFIGLGIPYGNSNSMPFVRSYFNGGSNDVRAWRPFGGLGPADSQIDERIRTFAMGNVKLTSSIEYRYPLNNMYEIAAFADAGNVWSLQDNGFGDQFKFDRFLKQMGLGSGLGLRINVAYVTLRLDFAYKLYDPNKPIGDRWRFSKFQPLKPTFNLAFGYPF